MVRAEDALGLAGTVVDDMARVILEGIARYGGDAGPALAAVDAAARHRDQEARRLAEQVGTSIRYDLGGRDA